MVEKVDVSDGRGNGTGNAAILVCVGVVFLASPKLLGNANSLGILESFML